MKRMNISALLLAICGFVHAQFNVKFSIGDPLQTNMVIQQGKPMKVWGTAAAGDDVQVKADWMKYPIDIHTDENNKWLGVIKVPSAVAGNYTPHTITFIDQKDTLTLNNILIGEVWLCSGQSNMDMQLKPFLPWLRGVLDYENEIAKADHPDIRLLDIQTDFKAEPVEDVKGTWKVCTPETAGDFSAVAYYFALELLNRLHVPVGLITSCVGASSCQAWTSRATLSADPVLKQKYLFPYDTSAASKEKLDSVVTFEKVVRPTLFYNAMIYPLRNVSLRGFLWYQGESNKDDKNIYTRLNIAMIRNWRVLFAQGDLPFYLVEVAPYNWQQNDSTAFNYAIFREAQLGILKEKNTGIASTMDIGDPDDIHPRDKKSVGIRLALNALSKTYGINGVVYEGPRFSNFVVKGDSVTVYFKKETIASGLATSDQQPPRHFFVAEADQKFYPAEARIVNNKIILYSPNVREPVAVRYAFTNYPITNLCNKEGLPATPFRTDRWDVINSSITTAQQ